MVSVCTVPARIEMVSVCTVPARGGRSCEHFGGYKTINRIPLGKGGYLYLVVFASLWQVLSITRWLWLVL